jgi:hypothetical protein
LSGTASLDEGSQPGVHVLGPNSAPMCSQESKSVITTSSLSSTMMLLGFRSLWIRPKECRWRSPSPIARMQCFPSKGFESRSLWEIVVAYFWKTRHLILPPSRMEPKYAATLGCGRCFRISQTLASFRSSFPGQRDASVSPYNNYLNLLYLIIKL